MYRFSALLLRRYLLGSLALIAAWMVFAWWGAPWIIRSAYDGTSLPPINDLITGQGDFPASFYVGRWTAVWPRLTLAVLGVLALGVATAPLHGPLLRRVVGGVRQGPHSDWVSVALIGGCLGWWAGLIEGVWEWLRHVDLPFGPAVEVVWMAPTAGAAAGAVLGALLGAMSARSWVSLQASVVIIATLLIFGVLRDGDVGIHPAAGWILALGIAVQIGIGVARRPQGSVRLAGRVLPFVVVASLAFAVWHKGAELRSVRQATASLGPVSAGAPNVILIVLDTQRASHMSLYGYSRSTTPEIDRFAERSVVFDNAVATSSWTLPSHASLLTGRWASELSADSFVPLDDEPIMLAEVLSDHGYLTAGFVANHGYVATRSGMSRGFSEYHDHPVDLEEWLNSQRLTQWITRYAQRLFGVHRVNRVRAPTVNEEFLGWLDGVDRPFFAFLNYFDVHDPYESPPPFDTLYRSPRPRHWLPSWGDTEEYSEAYLAEMTDAYDSSISYLDHHVGLLLESLSERNVLDNTIVVITADHGESLGERGIVVHAKSLYLPEVHIPLIIYVPEQGPGGVRVGAPASIRDIPATILDLAGIGTHPIPGNSLAPLWAENDTDARTTDPLLLNLRARRWFLSADPVRFGEMHAAVSGRLHYVIDGEGHEELYDVIDDPQQRTNLIDRAEYAEAAQSLRTAAQRAPRQPPE